MTGKYLIKSILPVKWYNACSLVDEIGECSSSSDKPYIQRVWTCPLCKVKLAVNMAEQLQHQARCKKEMEDAAMKNEAATVSQDPALLKEYHCPQCATTLQLTAIDILKHKRNHARTSCS